MTKDETEILEQLQAVIDWYHNNGTKAPIHMVMNAKDKIVTLNYNLADIVSDISLTYHKYYYIRKIKIARTTNALVKSGSAVNKAVTIATEDAADDFDNEMNSESVALKLDMKLRQSNKIVDAMQQRISVLKAERSNTNNSGLT